ncbi:MAG TPA: carbon storage regulator [Ktedonobacterales bacterium]|nr:carbon storage regulator [Ktedonobacterales bacterium]
MLVLRRKAGEAIVLNGVITIHVLAVEGERVKLGISAPPEVVIVRSELLEGQGQSGGPMGGGYGGPAPMTRENPRPYREPNEGEGSGGARGMAPEQEANVYPSPNRYGPRRRSYEDGPSTPTPLGSGPLRNR